LAINLLVRLVLNYATSDALTMTSSDIVQGVSVSAALAVVLPRILKKSDV